MTRNETSLLRAPLCIWLFAQKSIWQKKQEAGIKVHFNGRHVQPDGLVPAPQLQYAFSPLQSYFDCIPSPNKNKTSIIYAILMHTPQFTSPHSPCTGFLYTSHGVKRSKILPGRDTTPSCPALESKKSPKQGTNLEGFFSWPLLACFPHSAIEAACLCTSKSPQGCRAVQKHLLPVQKAGQNQEFLCPHQQWWHQ